MSMTSPDVMDDDGAFLFCTRPRSAFRHSLATLAAQLVEFQELQKKANPPEIRKVCFGIGDEKLDPGASKARRF